MIPDFTIVLGLDAKHFEQLKVTMPTWRKHKPSLMTRPLLVFVDYSQLSLTDVEDFFSWHPDFTFTVWPTEAVNYGTGTDKWDNPQRHKMLAGFVHVPAMYCTTSAWMKIDTDSVATGNDDWIEHDWFDSNPAIVGHKWSFTKPPDQMLYLDQWAATNAIPGQSLNLIPLLGEGRLHHKRIASWCAFFDTEFTQFCSRAAIGSCGQGKLPVASQDGYLFYMAARLGKNVVSANMKACGWQVWNSMSSVKYHAEEAMR